jgi:hypothetical protein
MAKLAAKSIPSVPLSNISWMGLKGRGQYVLVSLFRVTCLIEETFVAHGNEMIGID